ncbi:MAG: hypothetical protein ABW168_08220 [Sedimenticola sp.]
MKKYSTLIMRIVASAVLISLWDVAFAACTDKELRGWFGDGPGLDSETYDPKIWVIGKGVKHYRAAREGAVDDNLPEFTHYLHYSIAESKNVRSGSWVLVVNPEYGVERWIDTKQAGVVCRSHSLRNEKTYIGRKTVLRIKTAEGGIPVFRHSTGTEKMLDSNSDEVLGVGRVSVLRYMHIFDERFDFDEQREETIHRVLLTDTAALSDTRGTEQFIGWVNYQHIIEWDTIFAVETVNDNSPIYADSDGSRTVATTQGLTWKPNYTRFPLLDESVNGEMYKVAYLTGPLQQKMEMIGGRIQLSSRLRKRFSAIRLLFLVDGTHSIIPELKAVKQLLKEMEHKLRGDNRILFALHAYRDDAYGDQHQVTYSSFVDSGKFLHQLDAMINDSEQWSDVKVKDGLLEDLWGSRELLTRRVLTKSLLKRDDVMAVGVIVGDHGSHKKNGSAEEFIQAFSKVYWCAVHAANSRPDAHDAWLLFNDQMEGLVSDNCFDEITSNDDKGNEKVAEFLANLAVKFADAQRIVGAVGQRINSGSGVDEAMQGVAAVIAGSINQVVKSEISAMGFDETVQADLKKRLVTEVGIGWIQKQDVEKTVFVTTDELSEWINLTKRLSSPERRNKKTILKVWEGLFRGLIAQRGGESLDDKTLEELTKMARLPLPESSILKIQYGNLKNMTTRELKPIVEYFNKATITYSALKQGLLPKLRRVVEGGRTYIKLDKDKSVNADIWYDYDQGEAGYIPVRYLPGVADNQENP